MKIPGSGVAFFDSGVGGLTVLDSCRKRVSREIFYYLGDNYRAPYGNLPPTLIRRYVGEAFDLFTRLRVKAVVLACNTATALCIDDLRPNYPFPIVGAEPAILPAAREGGLIFVLTTRATFNSERFCGLRARISKLYPRARIEAYPCDGLAGYIENRFGEGWGEVACFLPRGKPNAVVLGCTHYIYVKDVIEKFYNCPVFHGNDGIAERLIKAISSVKKGENYASDEKIWDTRPLLTQERTNRRLTVQKTSIEKGNSGIIQKANKCSPLKISKNLIMKGIEARNDIYFLGDAAKENREYYERMFAF